MKRTYEELMKEIKEKWTVENITAVLDSMGVEYELMSEEDKSNEIKYKLKHKSTGQYVSYLGVADYREGSMIPEKIDAIEFTDLESEAEEFFFEWEDNDLHIVSPLANLELFYTKFFLELEEIKEDDEEYVFYSEETGMFLWGVGYDWEHGESDVLLHHLQFNISPQTAKRFKIDSEEYHAIRSKTYLRRVDVSDLD